MKSIILFLCLLICSFCLAQIPSKKAAFTACEKIELKGNSILINLEIENQPQKFQLDFNTASSIGDSLFISRMENFGIQKNLKRRNGKSSGLHLHVSNKLLEDWNKSFKIMVNDQENDDQNAETIGIYGNDFFDSGMAYHFDFDNMELCGLVAEGVSSLVQNQGYLETKSKFKGTSFSIFITMKWKSYEFVFDMAFDGMFCIPSDMNFPFLKDTRLGMESSCGNSKEAITTSSFLYKNKPIYFNEIGYRSDIIMSNCADPKAGLGFIKGFNWIVDLKNKKVYVKKNSISLD